jgi:hypothetical protein
MPHLPPPPLTSLQASAARRLRLGARAPEQPAAPWTGAAPLVFPRVRVFPRVLVFHNAKICACPNPVTPRRRSWSWSSFWHQSDHLDPAPPPHPSHSASVSARKACRYRLPAGQSAATAAARATHTARTPSGHTGFIINLSSGVLQLVDACNKTFLLWFLRRRRFLFFRRNLLRPGVTREHQRARACGRVWQSVTATPPASANHLLRCFIDDKLRKHPAAAASTAPNRQLRPGTAARSILEELIVCRRNTVGVGRHVTYDGSYVLYVVGCNRLWRQNKESVIRWHACSAITRSKRARNTPLPPGGG